MAKYSLQERRLIEAAVTGLSPEDELDAETAGMIWGAINGLTGLPLTEPVKRDLRAMIGPLGVATFNVGGTGLPSEAPQPRQRNQK